MICSKCGAENPDTSTFCEKCGSPLSAQSMQTAQPVQPTQPMGGQPDFGQQPAYAAPVYTPVATKKSKTVPVIIGACAVVVVAFLVVLFVVILPNAGGIESKLAHKWSYSEEGATITYDFKENNLSMLGMLTLPIEWEVKGDDKLSITMTMSLFGETQSETEEFTFSLSSNGKELTLKSSDGETLTLKRDD